MEPHTGVTAIGHLGRTVAPALEPARVDTDRATARLWGRRAVVRCQCVIGPYFQFEFKIKYLNSKTTHFYGLTSKKSIHFGVGVGSGHRQALLWPLTVVRRWLSRAAVGGTFSGEPMPTPTPKSLCRPPWSWSSRSPTPLCCRSLGIGRRCCPATMASPLPPVFSVGCQPSRLWAN
jgi:hypothetical protein